MCSTIGKGLDADDVVRVRPESITAVERATPVRDCLSLMLGNDLLYAPVTENKKPIDVVSLRDINLYLAPTDGRAWLDTRAKYRNWPTARAETLSLSPSLRA